MVLPESYLLLGVWKSLDEPLPHLITRESKEKAEGSSDRRHDGVQIIEFGLPVVEYCICLILQNDQSLPEFSILFEGKRL